MMNAYKLIIDGVVQGVGFRNFVYSFAEKHNIKGYVKNLPNGKVEVMFLKKDSKIDSLFINILKQGPLFSDVKSVEIDEVLFEIDEYIHSEFMVK